MSADITFPPPTSTSTDCTPPFTQDPTIGCIWYEDNDEQNYCDAMESCKIYNAELWFPTQESELNGLTSIGVSSMMIGVFRIVEIL